MRTAPTLLSALLLALVLVLNPLQAADDSPSAAVLAADDERVSAIVAADRARLTAIFSDDLRYAHSTGAVDGKTSYIRRNCFPPRSRSTHARHCREGR